MAEYGLKRKTIANVLNKKIKKWLDSIEDKNVRDLARRNTIVTGGSITSMLMGDPINDFDVYFRDKETTLAVAKYYCAQFVKLNPNRGLVPVVSDKVHKRAPETPERVCIYLSNGVAESDDAPMSEEARAEEEMYGDAESDPGYTKEDDIQEGRPAFRPIFLSTNAITLSDKIQIVIRFYGEPEEIHKNYDFAHCKNVWDHGKQELILNPESLEAILSKNLHYTGSLYPICSLFRMRKFLQRGWRIGAGEILKMAFQISKLDLNNEFVLMEQLVGCDMLYFKSLIHQINLDREAGLVTDIDSTYIGDLIDKVFNQYHPENEGDE